MRLRIESRNVFVYVILGLDRGKRGPGPCNRSLMPIVRLQEAARRAQAARDDELRFQEEAKRRQRDEEPRTKPSPNHGHLCDHGFGPESIRM